jgi:dTDP-4-dehydrorhamnose 3,5-epimerase
VKIVSVTPLVLPEIHVIRFARFGDHRGYFVEPFRRSDLHNHPLTPFMKKVEFVQLSESFSRAGTIRGMHFQWNPYMGKLVRTLFGYLVDLILDIRKGSPTFGKMIACDMPAQRSGDTDQWIWIPPGFAHGTLFLEDTLIEYLCSGEYSIGCETGVSPLAKDVDWSLCEPGLRETFGHVISGHFLMTDKDKNGLTLADWAKDERSRHFIYGQMS